MSGGRVAGPGLRSWGFGLCLLAILTGRPARAENGEEDGQARLVWSVGTGCGLALLSMAVGGGIAAGYGYELERPRKTGMEIMAGGLALAPAVSHLMAAEWKRAAFFGGISLSLAAFTVVTVERTSAVVEGGSYVSRVPFGIAVATQVAFTTVGLIDSLMAGERARSRQRLALLPLVGSQALGLSLGGAL